MRQVSDQTQKPEAAVRGGSAWKEGMGFAMIIRNQLRVTPKEPDKERIPAQGGRVVAQL